MPCSDFAVVLWCTPWGRISSEKFRFGSEIGVGAPDHGLTFPGSGVMSLLLTTENGWALPV